MMNEFDKLFSLIENLHEILPKDLLEEFNIDGNKISVNKKDNSIEILITKEEEEEFFLAKEAAQRYKEAVEDIDDDLFVEICEALEKEIDLQRFDKLLEKEHFNKQDGKELCETIIKSSEIICNLIDSKIQYLTDIYNKFK